jgi:hypothetical protein
MQRKSTAICGRNTTTLPTPASAPSTSRLRSSPAGNAARSSCPAASTSACIAAPSGGAQVNITWKTSVSNARKINGPHTRCNAMASTRSLTPCAVRALRKTVRSSTDSIHR